MSGTFVMIRICEVIGQHHMTILLCSWQNTFPADVKKKQLWLAVDV